MIVIARNYASLSKHSIINAPIAHFSVFFLGNSNFSTKIFQIMVNNNLVCTVKDTELAIALLIAVLYIFNIEHLPGVVNVLVS